MLPAAIRRLFVRHGTLRSRELVEKGVPSCATVALGRGG